MASPGVVDGAVMISPDQLARIMPMCRQEWLAPLNVAMVEFDITTWPRQAAFLANVAHESGECRRLEENLSYSAERLRAVWPGRFPSLDAARDFERQPEKLANYVYGKRLGNSPTEGWKYRGRGLIQVTGKDNYRRCGEALDLDLVSTPDLLCVPRHAARSAGWFWQDRGLNAYSDAGGEANFSRIVRTINGGLNGLDERMLYWRKALDVLRD
ncbi:MAG TPA: glycoside hydrolase family 19 protein [Ramlibacter sp.]|nr:glycoside hydrolase family 19 protein [Ramlibacter sp.]